MSSTAYNQKSNFLLVGSGTTAILNKKISVKDF